MAFTGIGRIVVGSALALMLAPSVAQAQGDAAANYPNKPIRFIVGFAAGGGNDIFARLITQRLQLRLLRLKPGLQLATARRRKRKMPERT